jgi:hypothetical protein
MDREASKYKIAGYARLDVGTLDDIERAIANGYPVLVGLLVTDLSWLDDDEYIFDSTGSWEGSHGVLGLEHDRLMKFLQYTNFLTIQNSWGEDRGRKGFYYMAENFARLQDADLPGFRPLTEAWAVQFDKKLEPRFTREGGGGPPDVSKWAKEARDWAVQEGISDGKDPKKNVTREQLWTMLYRAIGGSNGA